MCSAHSEWSKLSLTVQDEGGKERRALEARPWPGFHSCGNKKGKREKFPNRKEEKREKRISLDLLCSAVTLSYIKKIQKSPENQCIK